MGIKTDLQENVGGNTIYRYAHDIREVFESREAEKGKKYTQALCVMCYGKVSTEI